MAISASRGWGEGVYIVSKILAEEKKWSTGSTRNRIAARPTIIISFLISHIDWSRSLITANAQGGVECGGMVWHYFFLCARDKTILCNLPRGVGGGRGERVQKLGSRRRRAGVLMRPCQVEHSWAGALWLSGLKQILLTHNVVSQNHSKPISHAIRFMSLFSTPPPIISRSYFHRVRLNKGVGGCRTLKPQWS